QCKPSEKIIPRAADGDQLGATQGENDANKSDDAAKNHDKPFGSAGWFPPIANQNDVPQLPEHRIPFIEPICGPNDRQCNVWRLVTSLEMSSVIFIAHPRRWIPDGATISRTQASCPLLAQSRHAQCADKCPLLGAKRTLTNRCLPISIYEFTASASALAISKPKLRRASPP